MFVPQTATLTAADRFVSMIDALCTVIVTGLAAGMSGPQVIGIWDRLTRILTRFAAILARPIKPRATTPRTIPAHPPAARQPAQARPFKSRRLPTGYAWLIRRLPAATPFAEELQRLIGDPQMAALLQANPGMARLLRPLCRMLGVQQPPELRPQRAPLSSQPAPEPPPEQFSPGVPCPPAPAWRPAPNPPDQAFGLA
ncbi:MAG TPA: hypothetical protein DDZ81_22380 [Acetobacteraceae bacterium]|jgi:hypothetical protein|nr:hypothetical protein [Acetobacteraceae bacterium]